MRIRIKMTLGPSSTRGKDMDKTIGLKILGLILVAASLYYFFRAVDLVSHEKPFFLSSAIALLIGLLLLDYGVRLVGRETCK